jgi:hypothetical protein
MRLATTVAALFACLLSSGAWQWIALVVFVWALRNLFQVGTRAPRRAPLELTGNPVRITLDGVGERKIEVVKVIREYVDIDASGMLHSLEHPPVVIGVVASSREGEELAERLAALDSVARLDPA